MSSFLTFRQESLVIHKFFCTFAGKNRHSRIMNTKHILLTCLLFAVTIGVTAQKNIEQQTQRTLRTLQKGVSKELAERRKANISQIHYKYTFNIPSNQKSNVTGTAIITFMVKKREDVVLDFRGTFSGVCILNDKQRVVPYKEEHIVLPTKHVQIGINTLIMNFTCRNTALNRHSNYLYTSFAFDNARSCIPCFDQPDLLATFTTELKIPEGWRKMASDSNTPIPSNLYAFAAGHFQELSAPNNGNAIRAFYLETDPQKTCQLNDIFNDLSYSLRWMEDYTGIKNPFPEYGMLILPDFQHSAVGYSGIMQLHDRRLFLDAFFTQEELQRRKEFIAHEAAHLWYGNIVWPTHQGDTWGKELFASYMAAKITRDGLPKADYEKNFSQTYLSRAIATERTDGTHPIIQASTSIDETAILNDKVIYNKTPVMMHMMEQLMGQKKMQYALQRFFRKYYFKNASWMHLIEVLDQEAPTVGIRQMNEVWAMQKGMPTIHTTYRNGKLIITQSDPNGQRLYWHQKFDIRIINDLGSSHTITVDMNQPAIAYELKQTPSSIIPNCSGNGYGHFTLDEAYTNKLAQRLIITRDDSQRQALLLTLFDNYLLGRIAPSYFGEIYRNMTKEKNPFIMQTCIDHMFKIAFDQPSKERQTLELCMMDLIPENRNSECRHIIIRKLSRHATAPEIINSIYELWSRHNDPLFDAHDYMEMAYRLAIMRPEEWQRIIDTERQYLTDDQLLQEFEFVSRACNPDLTAQHRLFNELLKPENRQHKTWALHTLELLNADVREPSSNTYIQSSLASLEYLQQTSDIFFCSDWLKSLLAGHKSQEALQIIEKYLKSHPNLQPQLRNEVLEAAWSLTNR